MNVSLKKRIGENLKPEDLVLAGHGRLTHASDNHPPIPTAKIGILIGNLGTPDATDYWSMRRYLSEFLFVQGSRRGTPILEMNESISSVSRFRDNQKNTRQEI